MNSAEEWQEEAFSVLINYTFRHFSRRLLKKLIDQAEKLELNAGDLLFKQGDPSTAVYIILKGRISAQLTLEKHSQQLPSVFFSRGALIGEIGVITQMPRSMSVAAQRKTTLMRLPAEIFTELYENKIIHNKKQIRDFYLMQLDRNKKLFQANTQKAYYTFSTLVPANIDVELEPLLKELEALNETEQTTYILRSSDLEKISSQEELWSYLTQIETEHTRILIAITSYDKAHIELILDISDRIILVANGEEPAHENSLTEELLSKKNPYAHNVDNLILIYKSGNAPQKHATDWIKIKPSLHIINYFKSDRSSLLHLHRYFSGQSIGLVLSGSGYRGMAYIGALKAFLDYGIPIDIIGGTSMGAIIGACFIVSKNMAEFDRMMHHLDLDIRRAFSWRELAISAHSVFTGRSALALADKLNEFFIEDLPIPFFCVSCDLSARKEHHHFSGKLGDALRASSAIPGLLPPMLIDGHFFVDGAVVNNTPVDAMRARIDKHGTIISIDLSNLESIGEYTPPEKCEGLKARLKQFFSKNKKSLPDMGRVLIKSFLIHADARENNNLKLSTVYIKPQLDDLRLLPHSSVSQKRLIDLGYAATVKAIKESPALLKYVRLK